ncbi:SDR family oxidoreductase [Endozoicomonas numazuensis]|uniref:C factor cell-cell signaling protein n=1 Tax=Endozoicomonas numazuensis TaxID=1137799 RepID=A0A081NCW8_9GAMM|nr:SDR family oxidoreductase [Endozoicomonas numazuensis]KEQ16291.1 C factor cell-cell signaling protein [Endozoicomonas numazuensis]
MKILVAGGTGGIGQALIAEILQEIPDAEVHATFFRSVPDINLQDDSVHWHPSDLTDAESVKKLSDLVGPVDWVINAVGMLHTLTQMPEKSITQVNPEFFLKTVEANVLPTLLLARYFMDAFKGSDSARFVALSARVGSISDNRLGGWYSYRASKAALNMILKTLSIEWQRKLPKGCVVAIHPGTVDTRLSEPFQKNVPSDKLFSPRVSAGQILHVIRRLNPDQSGQFLAFDGSVIDW